MLVRLSTGGRCGSTGPNKGMGVVGFGRADLGEQGACLLPVRQGGVRAPWMERIAEDQQGAGLAEAVAGVALDRQGPSGGRCLSRTAGVRADLLHVVQPVRRLRPTMPND